MQHIKIIIPILLSGIALPLWLNAQQELGLFYMQDLFQSQEINPAFAAERKGLTVALPSLYFNLDLPVAYNDVVEQNEDGDNIISIDKLLAESASEDRLLSHVHLQTLGAGFNLLGWRWSVQHQVKLNEFLEYPREMLDIGWNGNAAYIGQTVPIGPEFQLVAHNEFSLAAAKKLGKLGIGVRAKYLTGIGDASTSRTDATLFTSDDVYQLELTTDYQVNSSAFVRIEEIDDVEVDIDNYDWEDVITSNAGWGLDIGLTYDLTEKLQLSASVMDIGQIQWDEQVENYTSQGTTSYDGLFFEDIFNTDSLDFQDAIDTLDAIFEFEETNNSYSTDLPMRLYLGGQWSLNEQLSLGAVFLLESFRERNFYGFSVGGDFQPLSWLTVGGSYAWRYERFDNLGLRVGVTLGPVQFYALTDNIIGAIRPDEAASGNGRIGLNLDFSRKR